MLLGTFMGLLVVPGLYYIFGNLADRGQLLPGENERPLSELPEYKESVSTSAHPVPPPDH